MISTSLVPAVRNVMRKKYRFLSSRAGLVARPDDLPSARVPAPIGHRILVVGNEYAISWGVRLHALALPGQLARELALRTGLGADVDVVATPGMSITDALASFEGHDLNVYDAVVVLTGVGDAFQLMPPGVWRERVDQLTSALLETSPPTTTITVVGIQPASSINITRTKENGLVDQWAESLNKVTEAALLGQDRLRYLPAPAVPESALDAVDRLRFKSPAVYKAWAVTVARHLVPLLDTAHDDPTPDDPDRKKLTGPLALRRRLAALEGLAIIDSSPEARYTSIVRRARDLFGTEGAVFSLITDTRQWNKAIIGSVSTEVPIEESFCATTIRSIGAFVVEDAWKDSRISFDTEIRFYAGYPVSAPDGTPIGALCIFDGKPRDASSLETTYLRELALMITYQLAHPTSAQGIQAV
ncbi:GAF domain-containing protein [Frondihabitans sp. PhB188]|uniref:GAF domain-containing protein n=1 Tax=Frondihabitans sp. PhB188 TaxID=2485200 RepID=UPI000FC1511A|nr:GAF domain-containing protein [Frondihabitans sp. PhB188]ROQ37232.1 GAF domain-containing protein [Frondihabitans sp. PhB188]